MTKLRVGVSVRPQHTNYKKMRQTWQEAEELGADAVFIWDHFFPLFGDPNGTHFECWTLLAALAEVTERVQIGALVACNSYRNPNLHADMARTIDHISGGRAVLGIGAAWFEAEHDAYGFRFPPLKERFERLEDALRIARAMFTEERATVEGTHHSVHGALNNPRPLRGDIPILIGGSGERKTLRFVAQYADACNLFGDVERVQHLLGVLDRHCEDVGRVPSEITRTRMTGVLIGATHEDAERKKAAAADAGVPQERLDGMLLGDPDSIAEQAQAYADIGIEGLTITLPDTDDLETIALVGRTLAPVFA